MTYPGTMPTSRIQRSVLRTLVRAALGVALTTGFGVLHAESLFQEQSFRPLAADNKAFRVGDVLTVQVFENSSASTSADTGTRRRNGLTADIGHGGKNVAQVGISVGGNFDGGGQTQRANRVLATLTVTVQEVLLNGDLLVGGEQVLTVNDEPQKVSLQGRVRPLDISDNNVVLSTRLADARITYMGEGDLAERSRRSWWRGLLDSFGL